MDENKHELIEMTKSRLKVGYEPFADATPAFVDNFGTILELFTVDFVCIDDYHPLNRSSVTDRWAGAYGWLYNGSVEMLEDYSFIIEDKMDSFQFTNIIRAETICTIR
jgi:hypothetical protein